ncbi:MAG: MmgE/PrpD family protein [Deltaproteobacteria bacterium]|jgi:2-methylcitrate dehydratase PrpD|nr:MmgE/PrpD family protein [Deltaproteobacteria bacterium]
MTLTAQLIELIESKAIGKKDSEVASWFVLDAIANFVAGRNSEQGRILEGWYLDEPAETSRTAFWIGASMHIQEVDDLHRQSVIHPGCVVIPTVLALGMREDISGLQMLEAVVKGFEVCTRIGNSVGPAHYKIWHNTATCGPFGAAYAAGTLFGLEKEQFRDALGNAGTQSSGLWEFSENGAMSKHLHAGRAGQSGLLSAELAKLGFSGSPTILEGKRGFYAACCPDANPDALLVDPEGSWQIHKTSIKPWPCCRHTHPAIDAALELSSKLDGGNIESIELGVTQATIDVCDKPTPETLYDAKFSLQHCVSVAIVDGQVGFDAFESDARQRVSKMAIKISLERNEEIEKAYPNAWGAEVKVKLTNGKKFSVRRKHAKGDPDAPLSPTEFKEKATMLFRFGGVSEPEAWVERILKLDCVSSFRDSQIIDLLDVSANGSMGKSFKI